MSITVSTAARRRIVGSPTLKAVLLYMADCASDDGTGIWTSKANMAADLELSKRSVQLAIQSLAEMGIVSEVGKRSCSRGFTVEYRINAKALLALPCTRQDDPFRGEPDSPVQEIHLKGRTRFTSRGEPDSPKPSLEPSLEPSIERDDLFADEEAPKVLEPVPSPEGQFDAFWAAFPPKQNSSKKNAKARFMAALRIIGFDDLMRATRAYAASRQGEDPKFTKAAEFWLNGEYWTAWLREEPIDPARARLRTIIAEAQAAASASRRS